MTYILHNFQLSEIVSKLKSLMSGIPTTMYMAENKPEPLHELVELTVYCDVDIRCNIVSSAVEY